MTTSLLTSRAYGRQVGLRVPTTEVGAVRTWLPWWWVDDDVEPEVTWDASTAADGETVVRRLELWVAEHARDRVFVHAGVVVVDGRAIVLPGRSGAGKSTLVLALLRLGATYASDEYAVVDPDGRVEPYPRRIAARRPDGSRRYLAPQDLGALVLTDEVPVGLVATVRHDAAARRSTLVEQSRAGAVLDLLDNTVSARSEPLEAVRRLDALTLDAVLLAGPRAEADECAAELLARVRG